MNPETLAFKIRQAAARLGFDACGIARADFLADEARYLENWLRRNAHGQMAYMANYFDERTDPRRLVHGAKTVISVLKNYFPEKKQPFGKPKISKYAFGADYHFVLKDKLNELLTEINGYTQAEGRCFVDSAPVLDKAWAKRAGLGWIGKHTNLIRKGAGSFYFIGEIILDLELPTDAPVEDFCGSCRKCIDACPTQALTPYEIDASRCISYLTIELKDQIPAEFHPLMDGWAYGCDVCQDVCPWNRFAQPNNEPYFQPLDFLLQADAQDWLRLTTGDFKRLTKRSAMSRVRRLKMLENVALAAGLNSEKIEKTDDF